MILLPLAENRLHPYWKTSRQAENLGQAFSIAFRGPAYQKPTTQTKSQQIQQTSRIGGLCASRITLPPLLIDTKCLGANWRLRTFSLDRSRGCSPPRTNGCSTLLRFSAAGMHAHFIHFNKQLNNIEPTTTNITKRNDCGRSFLWLAEMGSGAMCDRSIQGTRVCSREM